MPFSLLFLIGLTAVCFSTIFLMEQQPDEVKPTAQNTNSNASRDNSLETTTPQPMGSSSIEVAKSRATVS